MVEIDDYKDIFMLSVTIATEMMLEKGITPELNAFNGMDLDESTSMLLSWKYGIGEGK